MAKDEICFEAPEINMASDIVLDARVSVVTVTKLVDVRVKGDCVCPDGRGSPVEVGRRRSPSPVPARRRSPSPVVFRKRTPSPVVVRKRTPSPPVVRRRSPSPVIKRVEKSSSSSSSSESEASPKQASPKQASPVSRGNFSIAAAPPKAPDVTDTELEASYSESQFPKRIRVTGKLKSEWKSENLTGAYQLEKFDQFGRPIYVREDNTSSETDVLLFHSQDGKKQWKLGPAIDSKKCWAFVVSKVSNPIDIDGDIRRKGRNWHELLNKKWIPAKNLSISSA